ncbi:MAG: glycosyltransferase, partial [Syntrophomonadaceae bacterium]|nr:glycosyltransferase [Syntrophomonadaceae bacterium]
MDEGRVASLRPVCLEDYLPYTGPQTIEQIKTLAKNLEGKKIQHLNTAAVGGGVAEILKSLVPLMQQVGLDAKWQVMKVNPAFCEVTKRFHNVFHGVPLSVTQEMFSLYREGIESNLNLIDPQADYVVLHDQQPLGLAQMRPQHPGQWIWYCHVDPVQVGQCLWDFLKQFAGQCDAAIYHLPQYAKKVCPREYSIPPAIDPLSEKNREVTAEESRAVLERLGIDQGLPMVLQVSRFDRLKNHIGVVEAFRSLYRKIPCQLVLAGGGADDDPEGDRVYNEVLLAARGHPRIKVLLLPPVSNLEINVLQRSAAVVVQNSVREGFGLTVSEALWKERPVVASPVGGISRQILDGQTGLVARSSEELA